MTDFALWFMLSMLLIASLAMISMRAKIDRLQRDLDEIEKENSDLVCKILELKWDASRDGDWWKQ